MKTHTIKASLIALMFIAVLTAFATFASSAVTIAISTQQPNTYRPITFFNATTTNATSTNGTNTAGFVITGAKSVIVQFSRGGATGPNTGSSQFRLQVTNDGDNWYDYNQLRLNTDTYSDNTFSTRVGTSTISAATSSLQYSMDTLGFYAVRCIVVETTDGDHTCKGWATF